MTRKKEFYSKLNVDDITDSDYNHVKRVCEDFNVKTLENIMICTLKAMHHYWLMFFKTLENVFRNL